jgi:CDP-2,3-bis-(O-geranylgeranyl)-sn-glycerol synthase
LTNFYFASLMSVMKEFFFTHLEIFLTIEIIFIAGVANMTPVFLKHIKGFNRPIDGGRVNRKTGKRILGDGKTWKGLIGGSIVSTVVGYIVLSIQMNVMLCTLGQCSSNMFVITEYSLLYFVITSFFIGFFALVGDSVKSYFKRKVGIERGVSWIPWDQIDWVLGAIVGVIIADIIRSIYFLKRIQFSTDFSYFSVTWKYLLPAVFIGFILHLAVKRIGYMLKIENKPL